MSTRSICFTAFLAVFANACSGSSGTDVSTGTSGDQLEAANASGSSANPSDETPSASAKDKHKGLFPLVCVPAGAHHERPNGPPPVDAPLPDAPLPDAPPPGAPPADAHGPEASGGGIDPRGGGPEPSGSANGPGANGPGAPHRPPALLCVRPGEEGKKRPLLCIPAPRRGGPEAAGHEAGGPEDKDMAELPKGAVDVAHFGNRVERPELRPLLCIPAPEGPHGDRGDKGGAPGFGDANGAPSGAPSFGDADGAPSGAPGFGDAKGPPSGAPDFGGPGSEGPKVGAEGHGPRVRPLLLLCTKADAPKPGEMPKRDGPKPEDGRGPKGDEPGKPDMMRPIALACAIGPRDGANPEVERKPESAPR